MSNTEQKIEPSAPSHEAAEVHRVSMTAKGLRRDFNHHLRYTLAKDRFTATDYDRYYALALAVRDRVIERWLATQQTHHHHNVKRVYYLSLEFLIGRMLGTNVLNLSLEKQCRRALTDTGINWHDLRDCEVDAGLGNGGLGRLAACFMDSLSTLKLPAVGYGLRYDYGIFNQKIYNGYQVEEPDPWLNRGYPWEIARPEFAFPVHFGGRVEFAHRPCGDRWEWVDTRTFVGMPYDLPVVGFGGETVNTLRLWSARAAEEFDLDDFNRGSYVEAVENKVLAENLTKVLYPNDNIYEGKELRLKQQYFFVACTLQDIIRRFKSDDNTWPGFADKVAIQLNDTHPVLVIPELMRILMDEEGLSWDEAWETTVASTAYTNHTVLPEALEKWSVPLFENLLPRHLHIIYEINGRFLREVATFFPMDESKLAEMSIIEEGDPRNIRMANLAVVGSSSVNGVAEIHTRLLRERVLSAFAKMMPEKFNNKTNGITPRRWLMKCNPALSELISTHIGDAWITDLQQLTRLEPLVDDPAFRRRFRRAKKRNKTALAAYIKQELDLTVSPNALFDVQVKRLHEYKRQLLLVLHTIIRFNRIKAEPLTHAVPRVIVFGAKAAPGYYISKLIIKLIHQVAEVINNDKQIGDKIKVVFLPNYRVSLAEKIIPAADLSEQISLAGTEASGTGNMKLTLNGALTIGTLDGANIEIKREVGDDNIFIFGMTANEVEERRSEYNPWDIYHEDEEIRLALDMIRHNFFSLVEPGIFDPIVESLLNHGDRYMLLADLRDYIEAQEQVDTLYLDHEGWDRKSILNVARAGHFSADRTIQQYAADIWHVEPCDVPH